jgi:uncharacterized protein YbbC (DUF1343 family)
MGLLEGINVNEGRGTDKPFLQFGAPWINAEACKTGIEEQKYYGIDLSPALICLLIVYIKMKNVMGLS